MIKTTTHTGSFDGLDGSRWRIDIWEEREQACAEAGELRFDADQPAVIEWPEKAKHEPLQSSCCTLRLMSMTDRQYVGLYAIAPGQCGVKVYRDGSLYWSGTLDTEMYEEPYESAYGYTVQVSFTDFGIFGRRKCALSGSKTIRQIITAALAETEAGLSTAIVEMVSTASPREEDAASPSVLDAVAVDCSNFVDEDGKPMTWQEALEGTLQPLALSLVQRAGKAYVYDLHALATAEDAESVEWAGDESTLGVDSVYNAVRIKWSAYVQDGDLLDAETWGDKPKLKGDAFNLNSEYPCDATGAVVHPTLSWPQTDEDIRYWSYASDTGVLLGIRPGATAQERQEWSEFTLFLKRKAVGIELHQGGVGCFKIRRDAGGQEGEGISLHIGAAESPSVTGGAWRKSTFGVGDLASQNYYNPQMTTAKPLFTAKTRLAAACGPNLKLLLGMELLVSTNYNPFASEDDPHARNYAEFFKGANFVYVPVRVLFVGKNGECAQWTNAEELKEANASGWIETPQTIANTQGKWVGLGTVVPNAGTALTPMAWLCYYDPSVVDGSTKKSDSTKINAGFAQCCQAVPPAAKRMTPALAKGSGQYIPHPPASMGAGTLYISVLDKGWVGVKKGAKFGSSWASDDYHFLPMWTLCKAPTVELRQGVGKVDGSDVEHLFEINPDAEEELPLSTIAGTSADGIPGARGALLWADGSGQVNALERAGRQGTAEELLAGTCFSQYADRHATLSGEVWLDRAGVTPYSEANQPGKLFVPLSEEHRLREGTNNIKLCEVTADEYAKEIEDE